MSLYQPRKPEIPGPVSIRQEGANPYDASGMPNLNISRYNYKDNSEVNENIHKGIKKVLESEGHAKLADPMFGNNISNATSKPMIKYSEKEQRLIYALRFEDFLNQEPAVTYRVLALHCFSKNLQNYLADNVRRCYNALQEGTPYRLTKEFDDLIEFPHGKTTREFMDDNYAGIF